MGMKIQVLKNGPVVDVVDNAFCPTGKGGGIDPSCGKGGGGVDVSYTDKLKAGIEKLKKERPDMIETIAGMQELLDAELGISIPVLKKSGSSIPKLVKDPNSEAYGGKPAVKSEVKEVYHQTHKDALVDILQGRGLLPMKEVIDDADAYSDFLTDIGSKDYGDWVFAGTNTGTSDFAAVSRGMLLKMDLTSDVDRIVSLPEVEGGLLMIKGKIDPSRIKEISFHSADGESWSNKKNSTPAELKEVLTKSGFVWKSGKWTRLPSLLK